MAKCHGKINLRENKVYDKCSNTCNFTYSYKMSPSSCKIKSMGSGNGNKSQYLDLKCFDGNNEIAYSSLGNVEITAVRLYSPSLNQWNGKRADAELILHHTGNGKHIYVCIPIKQGGKDGKGPDWFKKLQLNTLPVKKGSESNPTAPSFKLDDAIPLGGYYVMKDNGMGFSNCIPKSNLTIIFSNDNPTYIGQVELEYLKKRIHTQADGHYTASTGELIYNEFGTLGGGGNAANNYGEVMESECYQITDEDGKAIVDEKGNPWEGVSSDWVRNLWAGSSRGAIFEKIKIFLHVYWWIPVIVITIIALYIVYKYRLPKKVGRFLQSAFHKKSSGGSSASPKPSSVSVAGNVDIMGATKS
jgi:hypothetical protein